MSKSTTRTILYRREPQKEAEKPVKTDRKVVKPAQKPPKAPQKARKPVNKPEKAKKDVGGEKPLTPRQQAQNDPNSLSNRIREYINSHPFFKASSMCVELGVNKGNFHRFVNTPGAMLSSYEAEAVVGVIKNYGFQE